MYKSCSYLTKLSFCVVDNYPKLSKLTPWGPTRDYKLMSVAGLRPSCTGPSWSFSLSWSSKMSSTNSFSESCWATILVTTLSTVYFFLPLWRHLRKTLICRWRANQAKWRDYCLVGNKTKQGRLCHVGSAILPPNVWCYRSLIHSH
jgi:hypothetical protein